MCVSALTSRKVELTLCGNEERDRTEVVETVGIDLCGALRFVTLLQQLASKKKRSYENGGKKIVETWSR